MQASRKLNSWWHWILSEHFYYFLLTIRVLRKIAAIGCDQIENNAAWQSILKIYSLYLQVRRW